MKKTNIIAALAIIALSATQVLALELDVDKEMSQKIQTTVKQEVNTQAQKVQELPDYQSLNNSFIDKLGKAAAESKYETWTECPNCVESYPSEGAWTANTHSSVKEVYNEVLENYKNLLNTLNTTRRYNEKNEKEIIRLIAGLDDSIKLISSEERDEYVNFLCEQDRYFLKAKDSVVNMRFLVKKNDEYPINYSISYLNCYDQEPVKIKAHTVWKYLNSPEYLQAVGEGFQNIQNAGKY